MRRTVPARSAEIVELKATRAATARRSSWLEASVAQLGAWFPILVGAVFGLVYELSIVFAGGRIARPLATPYAVPIFDTPFALFAVGVGYLCLERHRLRQDFRSAGMGITLWLTALLALAHILAQPDYPANPGVNAGIAPYFFLLSYLTGLAGIGLAGHFGERAFALAERAWLKIAVAVAALSGLLAASVLEVHPILPSLVMPPGKFTPFGLAATGFVIGTAGVWALWGGLRRYLARDPFAGYLLLAAYIWTAGLLGFLLCPFRYSIPWYLAALARRRAAVGDGDPAVEPVGRDLRRALRVLPASTRVCRHRRRAAGGVRHPGIRRPRERTRLRSARGESAPRRGPARLFAAVARGDRRGGDSPGCAAAHAGVARRRLRGALRLRCARGLPPPGGGARLGVGPHRRRHHRGVRRFVHGLRVSAQGADVGGGFVE